MSQNLSRRALARTSIVAATTAAAGLLTSPPAPADEPEVEALPLETERLAVAQDEDVVHVVAAGESLAAIAAAHGIDGVDGWRRLFDANPNLQDPDLIEPGDEIRVPHLDEELDRRELPAVTATRAPAPGGAGSSGAAESSDVTTAGGVWDRLAQCEAGGNWSADTGNGFHGGLQFQPQTWNSHGGGQYAPNAHQATREQQIAVAERVLASQGWGAWPSCSRQLGLR